jgi:hypothetical protein
MSHLQPLQQSQSHRYEYDPLSPSIRQSHINPYLISLPAKESLKRSKNNKGQLHTFSLKVKPKPTSEKEV